MPPTSGGGKVGNPPLLLRPQDKNKQKYYELEETL
jgi:hypothetical protein